MREIKRPHGAVESRPVNEKDARREELVFYYSREERLAKAPPEVRALYENQPPRKTGLLSSLTDTKPKALLFTSIVVMCLLILFMTYLMPAAGGGAMLGGNNLRLRATRAEAASFIVLQKKAASEGAYTGIVDVTVYPVPESGGEAIRRQFVWTAAATEEFRFSVPAGSTEFLVYVQAGGNSAAFTVKPE
jgi:hypothetical protein